MYFLRCLLDVFFPQTCLICGQSLRENECVCADCMGRFDRTEQAQNRDNETESLFARERHFAWGGCWLLYAKGSYLQQLIHRAKFGHGHPKLMQQLGRLAAEEWRDTGFFHSIDVMIPIPLHRSRLRERGFNQTEYIVKGMSKVLLIPMDTEHLTRKRATQKQSQSSFEERQHGVEDAFEVNHPEELYGKTVMLVDDIITTGATMRAAMAAFKDVYRCKIVVFALAKAK